MARKLKIMENEKHPLDDVFTVGLTLRLISNLDFDIKA